MKNSFAPIFTKILDSSVWTEPYYVRVLWTAMLALKDQHHIVQGNAFTLASRAKMTEQEVIDALAVLSSPDTKRIEPQPYGGRRIEKVDGVGWKILNGQVYEDAMRQLSTRVYKSRKQRQYRAEAKGRLGPIAGEVTALRRLEAGDVESYDNIAHEMKEDSIPYTAKPL